MRMVRGRGMLRPEPRETGPNVAMEVRRADGTVEFDAGTDGYAILLERLRAMVRSLGKLTRAETMSRHAVGLLVTAPPVGRAGIEMTPTVLSCTDPEIAGALWYGGLLSLKKHDPAAFAVLMRRLKDAGLTA